MITAQEVRKMADGINNFNNTKSIIWTLNWCRSLEEPIINSAQYNNHYELFELPKTPLLLSEFTKENYMETIKQFFIPLGYGVSFLHDDCYVRISW